MVDDAALALIAEELLACSVVLHTHARHLVEELLCVPVEEGRKRLSLLLRAAGFAVPLPFHAGEASGQRIRKMPGSAGRILDRKRYLALASREQGRRGMGAGKRHVILRKRDCRLKSG